MNTSIEFSESRIEISKALMVLRDNMKPVIKEAVNPHFKSKYADLPTVVDAVTEPLKTAGLVFLQGSSSTIIDGIPVVNVETLLLHKSGEWVRTCLGLTPSKNDPQAAGSAITYGRRYGLQLLCGIAPEDDDGNLASKPPAASASTGNGRFTPAASKTPNRANLELLAGMAGVKLEEFIRENVRPDYKVGGPLLASQAVKTEELLSSLAATEVPL